MWRAGSVEGAENIMLRGKRLAGTRINEPQPRRSTGGWSPFEPAVMAVHDFARPTVWRRWADLYRDALVARCLPLPVRRDAP